MQCMLLYISMSLIFTDIPKFFVFTKTPIGSINVSFQHNSLDILRQTFGYGVLLVGVMSFIPTPPWPTIIRSENMLHLLFS